MNESVSEGKWMEVKMKKMLLGFEPRVRSKVLFCGYSEGSQVKTFRVRHVPVHVFLTQEGQNNRTFIWADDGTYFRAHLKLMFSTFWSLVQQVSHICSFLTHMLRSYASSPLDGEARNFYLLLSRWIHKITQFIGLDPFIFPTSYAREQKNHFVWAGIKPRTSCFTSGRSNHYTMPPLAGLTFVVGKNQRVILPTSSALALKFLSSVRNVRNANRRRVQKFNIHNPS